MRLKIRLLLDFQCYFNDSDIDSNIRRVASFDQNSGTLDELMYNLSMSSAMRDAGPEALLDVGPTQLA